VLPALIAHLPADRQRLGLSPVQMAGRLGLTLWQYEALETDEMELHGNDLYLRICQVCGWPDGQRLFPLTDTKPSAITRRV
jgi:hypothetical protein